MKQTTSSIIQTYDITSEYLCFGPLSPTLAGRWSSSSSLLWQPNVFLICGLHLVEWYETAEREGDTLIATLMSLRLKKKSNLSNKCEQKNQWVVTIGMNLKNLKASFTRVTVIIASVVSGSNCALRGEPVVDEAGGWCSECNTTAPALYISIWLNQSGGRGLL